jgi:RNA polymerase sigma-70 factor (ECF subfamily)
VKNSPICSCTDAELIERICSFNDQASFSEIIRRYKGKIASTIFGMLGRTEGAEDIGQEVFTRFFKSISNFRGESTLGTYLTRIAINLSLNEIKRRKRRKMFSLDSMIEDGIELADDTNFGLIDEKKEIVQKAISMLNDKHRSVIVLRLIDDYSTEETAKILNLPAGTVLSRLARAQAKLKEILIAIEPEYKI